MVEKAAAWPEWKKLTEKDYAPDKPGSKRDLIPWKEQKDRKTVIAEIYDNAK
jgi:hypothetical protein